MPEKLKTTSREWKDTANKRRTRGLISTELVEIFEIYDDTPVAVHLVSIFRSKGKVMGHKADGSTVYRDPYYMKDEEVLKDIENYRAELDLKVTENETNEE